MIKKIIEYNYIVFMYLKKESRELQFNVESDTGNMGHNVLQPFSNVSYS